MKSILIILSFLFFISCHTTSKLQSECISKLKTELIDNWKYNSDSDYYKTRSIESFDSKYKECLMHLDSSEVIQIFGTPSKVHTEATPRVKFVFSYNVSPPCNPNINKYECMIYQFKFDSQNNVISALLVTMMNPVIEN